MIKKELKLKKINFDEFLKFSKKIKSKNFTIFKKDADDKKFAVIISSKKIKKAVDRNRIKRRIYEIIRLNIDIIPLGHFIIFPEPSCLKLDFKKLEEELIKNIINI